MTLAGLLDELLQKAMRLDARERATLAGLVIESLETEPEIGVEEAWLMEVEHRVEEIDAGAVATMSWEDVRKQLLDHVDAPKRG